MQESRHASTRWGFCDGHANVSREGGGGVKPPGCVVGPELVGAVRDTLREPRDRLDKLPVTRGTGGWVR